MLIIAIILFKLKLNALNQAINGEFILDHRFVKLYIYAKMKNNNEFLYAVNKTNEQKKLS